MEHKQLSIDDIEFLKSLGHEMNTQDDDSQADPRFWVVAENKREYGYDDGNCDGTVMCGLDGATYETADEFIEFLIENEYLSKSDLDESREYDFDDILDMLNDSDFYTSHYQDKRDQIAPNTMFLTKQECKRHIESNRYHYQEPHTYAMTAWRSPQVERLYAILKNTDWDKIAALKTENERLRIENEQLKKDVGEHPCTVCKHNARFNEPSPARCFTQEDCFEWRGIEETP